MKPPPYIQTRTGERPGERRTSSGTQRFRYRQSWANQRSVLSTSANQRTAFLSSPLPKLNNLGAYQIENFLNFSKQPLLLILVIT